MSNLFGSIGIVGGVGPYAGLDLMRKIFDHTEAKRDQDHLPVIHYSFSNHIADRTAFLLGTSLENPGKVLGDIMAALAQAGATVIGIPCNTAHSPAILDPALQQLANTGHNVRFVHMIAEVAKSISTQWPSVRRVGVLGTIGTYKTGIYQQALGEQGLTALFPDENGRESVQQAISSPVFGIKAESNPVTDEARNILDREAGRLVEQGAEAVILGCTEVPLALTEQRLYGVPLVDATSVLAKALITAFAPEKLKK